MAKARDSARTRRALGDVALDNAADILGGAGQAAVDVGHEAVARQRVDRHPERQQHEHQQRGVPGGEADASRARDRRRGAVTVMPRRTPQDVADAAHRLHQSRFAAGLERAPQVGDEDLQHIGVAEEVVAPDASHDRGARQHLLRVTEEEGQQIELAGGEVDVALPAARRCGRRDRQ